MTVTDEHLLCHHCSYHLYLHRSTFWGWYQLIAKGQSYTRSVSIWLTKSESKLFYWLRLLVAVSRHNTYPFVNFSDLISYGEVGNMYSLVTL